MDNALRGRVAEALVAYLGGGTLTHDSWAAWDLSVGRLKVEVKASGELQAWPQRRPSPTTFSIAPAGAWTITDGGLEWDDERRRRSDVYLFCHHTGALPDDPGEWVFYVVPTVRLDDVCGPQKSITLSAVCDRLGAEPCTSAELALSISSAQGSRSCS
jgi:hypothetical protein